jgi:large subunit ribosomal protein L21
VYAIVRAGGRQEKVAVGDLISLDRVGAKPGETLTLKTLLVVDGDKVTSGANELASFVVTAEVVEHNRGPKIEILRYKNKTGYRRRQGHRSDLTDVRIVSIGGAAAKKAPAKKAAAAAEVVEAVETTTENEA